MAKDLPPMVAAAMDEFGLSAEHLRSYEVTEDDVFLKMNNEIVFRVEISSLPASMVGPAPETTQAVGYPDSGQRTRIYLPDFSEKIHLALEAAGYDAEMLRTASQKDLEAVPGIGRATARKIRQAFDEWAG